MRRHYPSVFPEKEKSGKWRLYQFTGVRNSSTSRKLWDKAKNEKGKAIEFDGYKEAYAYIAKVAEENKIAEK